MITNDEFVSGKQEYFSFSFLDYSKEEKRSSSSIKLHLFIDTIKKISNLGLRTGSSFNLLDKRIERIIFQLNDFSFFDLVAKAFFYLYKGDYSKAMAFFNLAKSVTKVAKYKKMCQDYSKICDKRFRRVEEVTSQMARLTIVQPSIRLQFFKCATRIDENSGWENQDFIHRSLGLLDLFEKRSNKPNGIIETVEFKTEYFSIGDLRKFSKNKFDFSIFYFHTGVDIDLYCYVPILGKPNQRYKQKYFFDKLEIYEGAILLMGCHTTEAIIKKHLKCKHVIYSHNFINQSAINPFLFFFFREFYFVKDINKAFRIAKALSVVFNSSAVNLRIFNRS